MIAPPLAGNILGSATTLLSSPNGATRAARSIHPVSSRPPHFTITTTRPGTCSKARSRKNGREICRGLRAGAGVMVPRGTVHTYWNPGPGPVRYLLCMTPGILRLIERHSCDGRPQPKGAGCALRAARRHADRVDIDRASGGPAFRVVQLRHVYAANLHSSHRLVWCIAPCPLRWIDYFAMRNFTNDAIFDDTVPVADGVLEAGHRVPLDRLQPAMEEWFRRKGYLKPDERLQVLRSPDRVEASCASAAPVILRK